MEHAASPSFTFALALGAGVAAQLVARHLRLPSIVVLLATGVALGPDGLGLVRPDQLGEGLFALVSLAVAIILFEGGLNLDLRRLRREGVAIRRLVTWGALITAAGGGLAAWLFMDWSVGLAMLFGTLVIVTGPTVIRPLLRYVPLRPRVATVLEAEGLLIDPVGAVVAAVTLQVVSAAPTVESFTSGALGLVMRIGFGLAAGLLSGLALAFLLRWRRAVPEGLENLVALGGALVAFQLCELALPESGILAVTVAGVVVGNFESRLARQLGAFQEHLTVGLIGILFVLLAADVRLANVVGLGAGGLLTVAALALLVRPLNVWLCTRGAGYSVRERAFLSWVAPRGVVAAAIASIAAAFLEELGVVEAREIRALVFLTIALTVVVQGGTAPFVASLLGVRAPGREAIVIVGAEELSFALAKLLGEDGRRVVFADSNPNHCRAAEERGYPVVYGNALQELTLARMRLEQAKAVIGLTTNSEVNHHFASEARESGVREAYVAVGRESPGVTSRILRRQETRALFDRPKDVERWHVRFRHDQAEVRSHRFHPELALAQEPTESSRPLGERVDPYVVLAVRRGRGGWEPMHQAFELAEGDVAAVAVHLPEEKEAEAALRRMGFLPVPAAEPKREAASRGARQDAV